MGKQKGEKTKCKYCSNMEMTVKYKWKHERLPRHLERKNKYEWEKYMEQGGGVRVILDDKGATIGFYDDEKKNIV